MGLRGLPGLRARAPPDHNHRLAGGAHRPRDLRNCQRAHPTGLLRGELGDQYDDFMATLADRGLDPQEYTLLPVHNYQWETTITSLYASELAADAIVPLGNGADSYLPGQSVRTLFNVDAPEKHNVKLPMKIRNTLVWRGLPGDRTEAAPRVTEYITDIRDGDPFLRDDCELVLPGEVAGVNYDHPAFSELEDNAYQYDELLGAVWRESITDAIPDSQQAVTLAALLHEADGTAVISEFVERSPLELSAWLTELFDTLLPPLLHYLYRYGTVFSPHGENTIVILDEEFVPTRLGVKDFVDDVNISDQPLPELADLDADLRRVLRSEPRTGCASSTSVGCSWGVPIPLGRADGPPRLRRNRVLDASAGRDHGVPGGVPGAVRPLRDVRSPPAHVHEALPQPEPAHRRGVQRHREQATRRRTRDGHERPA